MNYRIVLQYDGSRYDGWQKQGNTANTIQGKLEQVLERMAGEPVEFSGAGRTDAGVHAMGQTANFHLHTALEDEEIKAYLNRYLPEDIEVVSIARVPDRFPQPPECQGKGICLPYRNRRSQTCPGASSDLDGGG